jgi:hypothetical protein
MRKCLAHQLAVILNSLSTNRSAVSIDHDLSGWIGQIS